VHGTSGIGQLKTESARERLADLNPHITVVPHTLRLSSANALDLVSQYDLVLDGSDNFPTRYLVNDACVLTGRPYIYGSIFRFEGQVSVFGAPDGPCYRCLFAEPPEPGLVPSCAEGGLLGVLPGLVGSLQTVEALKWILGVGTPLVGRLLLVDALGARFRELAIHRDPECPVCGPNRTIHQLIDYEAFCGVPQVVAPEGSDLEVEPAELARAMAEGDDIQIVDVREPAEWAIARLPGAREIPLGQLAGRLGELDPRKEVVAFCHHGGRSLRAVELLRGAGFNGAKSLAGGIDAWAASVDPTLARY
jgi:adenylyltransferase/sulfurtransferase